MQKAAADIGQVNMVWGMVVSKFYDTSFCLVRELNNKENLGLKISLWVKQKKILHL